MRSAAILLLSEFAAIGYGIVHDQITARVCVEYFSIGHPPIFPTDDPTIHVDIDVSLETVADTEKTALADDFSVRQTRHVLTVVSAAAKELKAGDMTQDEFDSIVEATMSER